MEEQTLFSEHPVMFRNNPVAFIVGVVLIAFAGLGLLILIPWWLRCLGTTLIITDKRTTLRTGILSKHLNEVYHDDVRNIQMSQNVFQRIMNVGTLGISSAGQSGVEIEVSGIKNPNETKKLIDSQRGKE